MGSGVSSQKLDKHAPPPPEFIEQAIAEGRVCPDEQAGAYRADLFHGNFTGAEMGFYSYERQQQWFADNTAKLAEYEVWPNVDIHKADADFAMMYGLLGGSGFPFNTMKPMLVTEKAGMVEGYAGAVEKARAREPEAFEKLKTDPKYASRRPEKSAGGGAVQKVNTLQGVFAGALGALTALWALSCEVAAAAKDATGDAVDSARVPRSLSLFLGSEASAAAPLSSRDGPSAPSPRAQ